MAAAKALVAGDPKDETTQLGPLASEQHYRKVRSYLDGIEADGGTIRTGGLGDGWVVLPTVVENAPPAARICREEVFGPVVTIAPFDDDEDAIRSANDTRYGLNAMVFTRDLSRAHRASAALRAGTVWVNCFFVRDLRAPFGVQQEAAVHPGPALHDRGPVHLGPAGQERPDHFLGRGQHAAHVHAGPHAQVVEGGGQHLGGRVARAGAERA